MKKKKRPNEFFRLYPEVRWFLIAFFSLFFLIVVVFWRVPEPKRRFANIGVIELIDLSEYVPPSDALKDIITEDEFALLPRAPEPPPERMERIFHTPTSFGDLLAQYDIAIVAAIEPALEEDLVFDVPPELFLEGIAGVVIARVGVDEDGSIAYAEIEQSVSTDIDTFVLRKIVTEARFSPALDAGFRPIAVEFFWAIPVGAPSVTE